MFGLNQNQILAILVGSLNFMAGSTAQLTNLFGTTIASYIVSALTLVGGVVSVILAVSSGQSSALKQVAAMPGVERITVNAKANQTLAAIAIDPDQEKIEPTAAATDAVIKIAKSKLMINDI